MLDTVRFSLKEGSWLVGAPCSGWAESAAQGVKVPEMADEELDRAAGDSYFKRWFQHGASALRVMGDQFEAHTCEVSLPRLVYGQNGHELRPEDAETLGAELVALVHQVAPRAILAELTRCDLVKNFRGDVARWIEMFRGITHPKVRHKTKEWFGTGLTWPGRYVFVNMYDKRAEKEGVPGDIVRLEFQTRGRECARDVWDGEHFNLAIAYEHYRKLASGFDPRPFVQVSSIAEFVAWVERSGVEIEGLRPLQVLLAGMSRTTRYRWRRRVETCRVIERQCIVFAELLPADRWPDWVDYEPEVAEIGAEVVA